MDVVEVEGLYIWITYEASDAYGWGEQKQVFCDLLEPLGLVYSGSGCFPEVGWEQIDMKVPIGTDLPAIHDALDVDLGFAFDIQLETFPVD